MCPSLSSRSSVEATRDAYDDPLPYSSDLAKYQRVVENVCARSTSRSRLMSQSHITHTMQAAEKMIRYAKLTGMTCSLAVPRKASTGRTSSPGRGMCGTDDRGTVAYPIVTGTMAGGCRGSRCAEHMNLLAYLVLTSSDAVAICAGAPPLVRRFVVV